MDDLVKIVECPRDAWQGLPGAIPALRKADYLRKVMSAGFTHIDAVSFVSPTAVPQMADSEAVLELLDCPSDVEIIGIVVNERGAQRAIKTGAVQTLGFPYSISSEFLRRNQNQTQAESLKVLRSIAGMAQSAGLNVVAYVSMAFGNPYEDAWSIEILNAAVVQLIETGIGEISLADTVGIATPAQISQTVKHALAANADTELGVHLHARRQDAAAKIRAAYLAGCRRFDSAIGGLGGCPFAQDELVGNIPTEILIEELAALRAEKPPLQSLNELVQASGDIAREFAAAG